MDYLEWLRWPNGFECPHCDTRAAVREDGRYRCRKCRKRVSVTSGTLFDKTRTPLSVWFEVVWMIASSSEGVSAAHMHRELPIASYQTAWAMLGKLRRVMSLNHGAPLKGRVSVGLMTFGGAQTGSSGPPSESGLLVAGAIELTPKGWGRTRLNVIPDRSQTTLQNFVTENLELGSTVVLETSKRTPRAIEGYRYELTGLGPVANRTPGALTPIQRVFAQAKNMLATTYQNAGSIEHLSEYLDEFVFRFNLRHCPDRGAVFMWLLRQALIGTPITYRDLVQAPGAQPQDEKSPVVHPWRRLR